MKLKKAIVLSVLMSFISFGLNACDDGGSKKECENTAAATCNAEGKLEKCVNNKWAAQDCDTGKVCRGGACVTETQEDCTDGEKKCDGVVLKTCNGTTWTDKKCEITCRDNACQTTVQNGDPCTRESKDFCVENNSVICDFDDLKYKISPCENQCSTYTDEEGIVLVECTTPCTEEEQGNTRVLNECDEDDLVVFLQCDESDGNKYDWWTFLSYDEQGVCIDNSLHFCEESQYLVEECETTCEETDEGDLLCE